MNPKTPTSAMSQGGTFVRPGAIAWGLGEARDQSSPAIPATSAAIEHALTAAAKDPDRVTDLLDELSRGRLWLPLPDERPVTDGSAVMLPTVTYLSAEFVPAFTSVQRMASWLDLPSGEPMPHIVVPAADLARQMPAGIGIALNPGAGASVPIYPEGVGYLAATLLVADGTQVRVGRPPADPVTLLTEIRSALDAIPEVRQASRTWLSVAGEGEGLVISVTLHDPGSEAAHEDVLGAIEQAVHAIPEQGFPIDVTFPGEHEPDQVEGWIEAHAEPFYIRS
ncbi:MAG: enhanced serine sensitivity protein SseB C-terminal domain-containing protein [Streptosporangiaceae bacterium]